MTLKKEEVMEWMFDIQLGRRNLTSIQRIAVAEKKREYYERKAKEKQGTRNDLLNIIPNLVESSNINNRVENETNSKLACTIVRICAKFS